MSSKTRKFGKLVGFLAMTSVAVAAQSSLAVESQSSSDIDERLTLIEAQVQRIQSQMSATSRFVVVRNAANVTRQPVTTAYSWRKRMLEGN